MKHLNLYILAVVVLLIGCQRSISGTYLVSDKGSVVWLELVRTPDNHLTGQISLSALKPDGTIERNSVPVTGAIDGGNVTLTGNKFFGLGSFTLSGNWQGSTLTLNGGVEPTPFPFRRASLRDYQVKVAALDVESKSILSAKAAVAARQKTYEAQKDFISQIDQLIGRMRRFEITANVHLGRFPNAEKSYNAITAKVNGYVTRERQLGRNQNTAVDRSQLVVDANQASLNTDQIHYDVQALQSSLQIDIPPMMEEETNLKQRCREVRPLRGDLTPAEIDAHKAACGRLLAAAPLFRQKYAAMSAGLAHLEQVYRQERDTQQRLLQEAQKIQ